jgi:hypothetical protein
VRLYVHPTRPSARAPANEWPRSWAAL